MLNVPNVFTQGAMKALVQAQISAASMGHEKMGSGHLLCGLCRVGDELTRCILGDLTAGEIEEEVLRRCGRGEVGFSRVTGLTPHAQRALLRAVTYANPEKKILAGIAHIWQELLYEDGCTALIVPSPAGILRDMLPENAPYFNEDKAFGRLGDILGGTLLDSRETLSAVDDPYYRTDHHWTTMGAQAAYTLWAQATGHTARSYDLTLATDSFRGTLYSKVLLPDSVYDSVYYAPEITVESVVCDGKDGALYDLSALEQKDKYELFLGGNYGQCAITTGTENGKHLLLVKDSFANSFVPFLTGDYETITMIDLRYYRGSMAELAAEADDILVLTEVTNLAGSGDYFKLSK